MYGLNLGTLLRTCDAVGACLAVPRLPWVPDALARGNTLRQTKTFHSENRTGWEIPWQRGIDIDTFEDWAMADVLFKTSATQDQCSEVHG